jgi:heptosyltransferase-2
LAIRLKRELGLQVLWFLEHSDQAREYALADPFFCGPLDEVAAALGMCRLAVSNDSGLLHIAVAAGCRTVQLFGPGDASRFAHTGNGLILLHDTSCLRYPCTQRGTCANLSQGWCLEKISVEEVFASCAKLMSGEA